VSNSTAVVSFPPNNWIMQLDDKPGVLFWSSCLHVDADGSPKAYHPDGSPPGLDYIANAGYPGNWWGIACDSDGDPYIQQAHQEAPGYYVSTTALIDNTLHTNSPARYVNSGKIPFIVLPSSPKFSPKQKLGDLSMVFNTANARYSWAIYADIGPRNAIGEGSMALCEALGLNPSPKTGGTEAEVIATVYWPGSVIGWPRSQDELKGAATQLFKAWGGFASCQEAMPQFDWTKFS
jgi:Fungal chitosanase of glycosyl hydrolase group 75